MAKGKKTGGRTKGTPNKVTQTFREILEEENFEPAREAVIRYRAIPEGALWDDLRFKYLSLICAYSQTKPKENDIPPERPQDPKDSVERAEAMWARVKKLEEEAYRNANAG